MSHEEKYGERDLTYSAWHRRNSLMRFVGIESAQTLHMIDMDVACWVEYDEKTKEPLALIETAMDVGQGWKTATVTKNLALRAGIPAYCVLYSVSNAINKADPRQKDIDGFRVKRLTPSPEADWRMVTPDEWAKALVKIRAHSAYKLDKEWDSN